MEVAAFWVALAAVVIMFGWFKSKGEVQRHQTFRTIVEKTGTVDEAQLRLLFNPRATSVGRHSPLRVRVLGAIGMFVAICVLIVVGWMTLSMFELTPDLPLAGALWSILVTVVGVGFFMYAARLSDKVSAESERERVGSQEE